MRKGGAPRRRIPLRARRARGAARARRCEATFGPPRGARPRSPRRALPRWGAGGGRREACERRRSGARHERRQARAGAEAGVWRGQAALNRPSTLSTPIPAARRGSPPPENARRDAPPHRPSGRHRGRHRGTRAGAARVRAAGGRARVGCRRARADAAGRCEEEKGGRAVGRRAAGRLAVCPHRHAFPLLPPPLSSRARRHRARFLPPPIRAPARRRHGGARLVARARGGRAGGARAAPGTDRPFVPRPARLDRRLAGRVLQGGVRGRDGGRVPGRRLDVPRLRRAAAHDGAPVRRGVDSGCRGGRGCSEDGLPGGGRPICCR